MSKREQRKISKKHLLQRLRIVGLDEVLPFVVSPISGNAYKQFGEHMAKMCSTRMWLFTRSVVCVECGLKGSFFALERTLADECRNGRPHLNLYAVDASGDEVLMTQDHIRPRSKGGNSAPENLQVMCKVCNEIKGDTDG